MKKLIVLFIVFIFPAYAFAQRQVDKKPVVHTVTIEFNGETIKGFYCFIDARSNEEKSSNVQNKALHESVILFLQGHAQRADDAYKFTSQMALTSKSGIVVVVVCDTPYGKDSQYRGDAGKEIVVMAIAQHALTLHGINVIDAEQLSGLVTINGKTVLPSQGGIPATITVVGWSHGVIFGSNDSLFNPQKLLNYRESLNPEDVERFWLKYYPEAVNNNARMNLFVLPGKHLAPVLYYKEYAFYTLKYTNELKE